MFLALNEAIDPVRDVLSKRSIRRVQITDTTTSRPSVQIGLLVVNQQRLLVRTYDRNALDGDLTKHTLVSCSALLGVLQPRYRVGNLNLTQIIRGTLQFCVESKPG